MSERKTGEPERTTGFPEIPRGMTHEVLFDWFSNRREFVRQAALNLKQENPSLVDPLVGFCASNSDPHLAFEIGLIYYEILSRSARRAGKILMEVTPTRAISYREEFLHEVLIRTSKEELGEMRKEKQRGVIGDSAISPELVIFWIGMKTAYIHRPEVLHGAIVLRDMLMEQAESNDLSRRHPDVE